MHAPALHAHLTAIGAGAEAWGWPLLASYFSRVLSKADWLVLWDHLLCAAPVFLLHALCAFVSLHAPILLRAANADDVANVLLRPSALQMHPWLSRAYAFYHRTPPELQPNWKPYTPLPSAETYPPGLPSPTMMVDHGARQLEQIRKSELELARQRALVQARPTSNASTRARSRR